jgi:hypothetical protein
LKQTFQVLEGAVHQNNLCGVGGGSGCAFQRNGDLCRFKGYRVVDAVADKANEFPFVAPLFD